MKVLFLNPPYPEKTFGFKNIIIVEPLTLEYLAAAIPEHESKIVDLVLEPDILDEVLVSYQPDVVTISALTVHVYYLRELVKKIKNYNSKIKIIVGGQHARFRPEDFEVSEVDVVAITATVPCFKDIIEHLNDETMEDVSGISYQRTKEWFRTRPTTEYLSIDDYPKPRRDLVSHYMKDYIWFYQRGVATVFGSMGCPNRCDFCTQWVKTEGKFIARSASSLVDEIAELNDEYVFIADDNTFLDIKRAWEIQNLLKARGIKKKLIGYCSPDLAVKHPDLIQAWAEVGLVQVVVGFESLREKDLQEIKHKANTKLTTEAIKIFRQNKIDVMASFILYPDMTKKDFKRLRKFVAENKLFYCEFTPLVPLVGTKLFERTEDQIVYYDYELFDMQHMVFETALPLKEFYKEMALCYISAHNFLTRAPQTLKVSMNPLFSTNKSYFTFLKRIRNAYKEHLAEYRSINLMRRIEGK